MCDSTFYTCSTCAGSDHEVGIFYCLLFIPKIFPFLLPYYSPLFSKRIYNLQTTLYYSKVDAILKDLERRENILFLQPQMMVEQLQPFRSLRPTLVVLLDGTSTWISIDGSRDYSQ